jgi:hypothetical protein
MDIELCFFVDCPWFCCFVFAEFFFLPFWQ